MRRHLLNVWRLGIKELYSLRFDAVLVVLIVYSLTYAVYMPARNAPTGVNNASIAVVDEDHSALSRRITATFLSPYFQAPATLTVEAMDREMDAGHYTFIVDMPPNLEADLLRGRTPTIQLLADATAMTQAGIGLGYVQKMIAQEASVFLGGRTPGDDQGPVKLVTRSKFNPNLDAPPFSAIVQLVNNITLLALFLSGAAIIREREHGTIEHLLVMPLTPLELMLAKVWANSAVILVGAGLSLMLVVRGLLGLAIAGSVPLFLSGVALYLFSLTSLGILLGTVGRSMPQFSLIALPIYMVMIMLSGGFNPLESMPAAMQSLMKASPSTHFMSISESILYRGADFTVVWREFALIAALGAAFFVSALWRFRRTLGA
jgi:ABC-2 type transport system permease protein